MAAALMLFGCSDGDTTATTTPSLATTSTAEPATAAPPETSTTAADPAAQAIAELDAAIRSGAQLLLDTPDLGVTSLEFGESGVHIQTKWEDRRANGDQLLFSATPFAEGLQLLANVWVGGERFCATSGPSLCETSGTADQPWQSFGSTDPEAVFGDPLLVGWAEGRALIDLQDLRSEDIAVTTETDDEGGTLWRLITPFAFAADEQIIRQWRFRADGFLQMYEIRSESGIMFAGTISAHEMAFVELDNPAPLIPPELGTSLEIDSLNLPQDLVLPDPAS
jgi:hypothetical protein